MQDNILKLHDGRKLGFSEYGKLDGIPLFLFHGTPGSRVIKSSRMHPGPKSSKCV